MSFFNSKVTSGGASLSFLNRTSVVAAADVHSFKITKPLLKPEEQKKITMIVNHIDENESVDDEAVNDIMSPKRKRVHFDDCVAHIDSTESSADEEKLITKSVNSFYTTVDNEHLPLREAVSPQVDENNLSAGKLSEQKISNNSTVINRPVSIFKSSGSKIVLPTMSRIALSTLSTTSKMKCVPTLKQSFSDVKSNTSDNTIPKPTEFQSVADNLNSSPHSMTPEVSATSPIFVNEVGDENIPNNFQFNCKAVKKIDISSCRTKKLNYKRRTVSQLTPDMCQFNTNLIQSSINELTSNIESGRDIAVQYLNNLKEEKCTVNELVSEICCEDLFHEILNFQETEKEFNILCNSVNALLMQEEVKEGSF